jgi:hypothetical protein
MKKFLIHCADMFDVYVLKHSVPSICTFIGMSSWWGKEKCQCKYCDRYRVLEEE